MIMNNEPVTPAGNAANETIPLGGVPTAAWQDEGFVNGILRTSRAELATAIPTPHKPWWRTADTWQASRYDILLSVHDGALEVGSVHAWGCGLRVGSLLLLERDRTGCRTGPRFARIKQIVEAHGVCHLQVEWRRVTHESLPDEEAADEPAPTIRRMRPDDGD